MLKQALTFLFVIYSFSLIPQVHAENEATPPTKTSVTATSAVSPVEKRITELHTKLKITADQETLWSAVANEMRDEGKAFSDAIRAREGKASAMTAIEDLNSYAEITELHAASMKKFVGVFTPLYTAMPDDQKKNADTIFQEHKKAKKRMSKS